MFLESPWERFWHRLPSSVAGLLAPRHCRQSLPGGRHLRQTIAPFWPPVFRPPVRGSIGLKGPSLNSRAQPSQGARLNGRAQPSQASRNGRQARTLRPAASPCMVLTAALTGLMAWTHKRSRRARPLIFPRRRATSGEEANGHEVNEPEHGGQTATAFQGRRNAKLSAALDEEYAYGFTTPIDSETLPKGLNEDVIRRIWEIKEEPAWMLEFRLSAFRKWERMEMPDWANLNIEPIDFQDIAYYSSPKVKGKTQSLEDIDPEILKTFDKLGIPLSEQKRLSNVAVDYVFDSESIATTFQESLAEAGVIFCSISEAIKKYPDLVRRYLGSVVPPGDNYFSALNSAVFSDGSFCYVPRGVRCPMEISTYFRINTQEAGQFERTLLIVEEGSYLSYLEGCTAPSFDTKQLHAAVVELHAAAGAEVKYSTVQNWYAGDSDGRGGVLNFVTKRGLCAGYRSKISWTQVETGSAITWKYPSCVLKGDGSVGEFYSVALTKNCQQADTGSKMIHLGKSTQSRIVSKGISAGTSSNAYRGLVAFRGRAENSRNFSQCDSLLIGDKSEASTFPYIEAAHASNKVEHEATTSRVSDDQLLYLGSRGLEPEEAVSLVIGGFCQDVFEQLPLEFAAEAQKLLALKLEGAIG